jgi:hypothetical protein
MKFSNKTMMQLGMITTTSYGTVTKTNYNLMTTMIKWIKPPYFRQMQQIAHKFETQKQYMDQ